MKLLNKINRSFLLASSLLIIIFGVLLFFLLRFVIYADVDENLSDERIQIEQRFEKSGTLPANQNLKSSKVRVERVESTVHFQPQLRDTLVLDSMELDHIPFREVIFTVSRPNENYLITVSESLLESDDLILTLLIFIVSFIVALFLTLYFINRRQSKSIWSPFRSSLDQLKSFDITGRRKVSFSNSGIQEFDELNDSLNKMSEKIYSDYNRLKQFTENASHEIQTPLSIIRSRIETLIQSENISEEQMNSIQKINESVSRLSKLNAALLTLTKIENYQFTESVEINIASLVQSKLGVLEELMQQKKIAYSFKADESAVIRMNPLLADLLFDNLLSNAIRHNVENGFIHISIQPGHFTISNSGTALKVSPEKLFDRFVKDDAASDSLGLGLAMVKQICVSYGFKIDFRSEQNIHSISILF